MARVKCDCCDQWIDEDEHPFSIACVRPDQYFGVPEHECSRRIRCSDNLCDIDGKMFFIRGVLDVPIRGLPLPFCWGLWAMVEERDFHRYVELCQKGTGEEEEVSCIGWLSNVPFGYPYTKTLEVSIDLQPSIDIGPNSIHRPLFKVLSEQHPLGVDQREGITQERAHHILADFKARKEAETANPFVLAQPKVGRNETCPCGSGKKYKKCCGA